MKNLLINATVASLIISGNVYGSACSSQFPFDYNNGVERPNPSIQAQYHFTNQMVREFKEQLTHKFESRVRQSLQNQKSLSWLFNQENQEFSNSKEEVRRAITTINNKFISIKGNGGFGQKDLLTKDINNFFEILPIFIDENLLPLGRRNLLKMFMNEMGARDLSLYQKGNNYHTQDIYFEADSQLIFRFNMNENKFVISAYNEPAKEIINSEIQRHPDGYIDYVGSEEIKNLFSQKTKNEYAKISILQYYNEDKRKVSFAINPVPHTPAPYVLASPEKVLQNLTFTYEGRTYNWNQFNLSTKIALRNVFTDLAMEISHNQNIKRFYKVKTAISQENVENSLGGDRREYSKDHVKKRKRDAENSTSNNSKRTRNFEYQ